MKRVVLAVFGVGALIGLGLAMNRSKTAAVSEAAKEVEVASAPAQIEQQAVNRARESRQTAVKPASGGGEVVARVATPDGGFDLNRAIETLVSPRASFREKQAAWDGLKGAGQLDQAISDLEQRMASDPQSAEYAAALGEAYMKKCAAMTDVREQAIFAMKADKTLETALNLDQSNWEARFMKAVGLSFWPANLNKSQEVVQEFLTLIQQQEGQPKEPQFAQPYLWLGKEYEKAGQAEYAARRSGNAGRRCFPRTKSCRTNWPPCSSKSGFNVQEISVCSTE